MKQYIRPKFDIRLFSCEAIVTVSGNGYTEELTTWQKKNVNAQLTKAKISDLQNIVKFKF